MDNYYDDIELNINLCNKSISYDKQISDLNKLINSKNIDPTQYKTCYKICELCYNHPIPDKNIFLSCSYLLYIYLKHFNYLEYYYVDVYFQLMKEDKH